MSLNKFEKEGLSYEEWKKSRPLNHRANTVNLEDEFASKFAYADYMRSFIRDEPNSTKKEAALKSVTEFLQSDFRPPAGSEDEVVQFAQSQYDAELKRVSEIPYVEKEGEFLENYFYIKDSSLASTEFDRLEQMGFNPSRYAFAIEKKRRIENNPPKYPYSKVEKLTDEEEQTIKNFDPLVKPLVEATRDDVLRRGIKIGESSLAVLSDGTIQSKSIAPENLKEEVDKAIRYGYADPQLRDILLSRLSNPEKISKLNKDAASNFIFSAFKKTVADENAGERLNSSQNFLTKNLGLMAQAVAASHHKPAKGEFIPFVTVDGQVTPFTESRQGKFDRATIQNYKVVLENFRRAYPDVAAHLSDEEVLTSMRTIAYTTALEQGIMPFHQGKKNIIADDPAERSLERLENNIYKDPATKITHIHPELFISGRDFNNLLERKDLHFVVDGEEDGTSVVENVVGEDLKKILTQERKNYLDAIFERVQEDIYDSTADIRNSWTRHIQNTYIVDRTKDNIRSRGEILGDWLDTESGRNFFNRIGQSLGSAAIGTVAFAASMLGRVGQAFTHGNEPTFLQQFGSEQMKKVAEKAEATRSVAKIFGRQASYLDDGVTMLAPLAIDLAATKVLAVSTGGVGGGLYATQALAKYGLRTTTKGYFAGLVGGGVRGLLKEAAEDGAETALQKAVARNLITKVGGGNAKALLPKGALVAGVKQKSGQRLLSSQSALATNVFEAAAKGMTAKRFMLPSMAAPAFLRSASATYGDIYMALKDAKDENGNPLTPEEIEDRAFGGGLVGGFITAATVVGLHALTAGRLGGLETWAAGGASVKGMRDVLVKLRGKPFASLEAEGKVVSNTVIRKGLNKLSNLFAKGVGGGAVGEGFQEGLDSFLNTFARSYALAGTSASDMNRPFMERVKEGGLGAVYGLFLGGTGGAIKGSIDASRARAKGDAVSTIEAQLKLATEIQKQTVKELEASGSPETAATVSEIFGAIVDGSRPATDTDTDADVDVDSDSETKLDVARDAEQDPRLKKLQDDFNKATDKKEKAKLAAKMAEIVSLSGPSKTPAEESREEIQEEVDKENEELQRISEFLTTIGIVDDAQTQNLPVIVNPNKYLYQERQRLINIIRDRLAESDLTEEQAKLGEYIIDQLETGVTEEQANANVESASEEQVKSATAQADKQAAAAKSAQEPSGTGDTAVTPDVKKELAFTLMAARGITEEEATVEVEQLMEHVRRDPEETEDLARIAEEEPILKAKLDELSRTASNLESQARKRTRRAYKAKIGKEHFNTNPNDVDIITVEKILEKKKGNRGRDRKDDTTRRQEILILESLLDTLRALKENNERKAQLEADAQAEAEKEEEAVRLAEEQARADEEAKARRQAQEKTGTPESDKVQDSGDKVQDSGRRVSDDVRMARERAQAELKKEVDRDVKAGVLRAGKATNALRQLGAKLFGFRSSLKANDAELSKAADDEFDGVNELYPNISFNTRKKRAIKKEVREKLAAVGVDIPEAQWNTVVDAQISYNGASVYVIKDTKGGIFDDGVQGGTGELKVLFTNDPRVMKKALDDLGAVSIPIPYKFPREKINPTFRDDLDGRVPSSKTGEVRSVYYLSPIGPAGAVAEHRVDGSRGTASKRSAAELITEERSRSNALLNFIDTDVEVSTSINLESPTERENRTEAPRTIADIINSVVVFITKDIEKSKLPFKKKLLAQASFTAQAAEDLASNYYTDLQSKAQRFAVELAILQAVDNKAEGQTDEEAVMSLFKKGEGALESLQALTGKKESDFENDNDLFGYVLSNILGRTVVPSDNQNVFEAVVDYLRGLERNRYATTKQEESINPVPDLYKARTQSVDRIEQDFNLLTALSNFGGASEQVDLESEALTDEELAEEQASAVSDPASAGKVVSGGSAPAAENLGDQQKEILVKLREAAVEAVNLQGVGPAIAKFRDIVAEEVGQTIPNSNDPSVFLEFMRLALQDLGETILEQGENLDIAAARDELIRTFNAADNSLANAAFLYLASIDAFGQDLTESSLKRVNKEALGVDDPMIVIDAVNASREATRDNAPSFLDRQHTAKIKQMNLREISEMGLKDGDLESVIQALRNVGDKHKLGAELFLQFEDYLRTLKFTIVEAGAHFAGYFDKSTGEVAINVSGRYGDGVVSVLLHEVGHAVFQKLMTTPESELTAGQRAAKKQMQIVYDRAREQWANAKKRGVSNRNLDYVFHTGRTVQRLQGPSGVVTASGDVPVYEGANEMFLDETQKAGVGSDVILPAAKSFEEFFTSYLSATDFQDATRKIAIGDRSLFRRVMDLIVKMFGFETRTEKEIVGTLETIFDFTKQRGSKEVTQSFESLRERTLESVRARMNAVGLSRGFRNDVRDNSLRLTPEVDLFNAYLQDVKNGVNTEEAKMRGLEVIFDSILKDEVARQLPQGLRVVFANDAELEQRPDVDIESPAFVETARMQEPEGDPFSVTQIVFNVPNFMAQLSGVTDLRALLADEELYVKIAAGGPDAEMSVKKARRTFRNASRVVRDQVEQIVLEETVHAIDDLVLTDLEKDALIDELGVEALVKASEDYEQTSSRFKKTFVEGTNTEAEERAKSVTERLRAGFRPTQRRVLSEMLRQDVQRVIKGASTEDTNLIALRATAGEGSLYAPALYKQLGKVMARVGLKIGGSRPEAYQRTVQRLIATRRALQEGDFEGAGFVEFDPNNPMGGMEELIRNMANQERTYSALKNTKVSSKETADIEEQARQQMVDMVEAFLELNPVTGKWSGARQLKGIKKLAQKLQMGNQDPRVQDLIQTLERWAEAMSGQIESDVKTLDKLVKRAYQGELTPDVLRALNQASGTTDNLDLDSDAKAQLKGAYSAVISLIKKEVKAGTRPESDAEPEALASVRRQLYDLPLERARMARVREAKQDQKRAYQFLNQDTELGPDIVKQLRLTRVTLDALSSKISKNFNLDEVGGGKLKMVFDRQSGIYLTRMYRSYDDTAYLKEILKEGGKYQARRDAALPFFEEQRIGELRKVKMRNKTALLDKLERDAIKDPAELAEAKRIKGMSVAARKREALEEAKMEVSKSRNVTVGQMNEVLTSIKDRVEGREVRKGTRSLPNSVRALLKLDTDALKNKTDIDERVRFMMGQYGLARNADGTFEEQGLDALTQTLNRLTSMAESSSFYAQLKEVGGVKDGDPENAFVFTLQEAIDNNLDRVAEKGERYVNVRTGRELTYYLQQEEGAKQTDTTEDGETVVKRARDTFDYSYDMFVPEDLFTSFRNYKRMGRTTASSGIRDIVTARSNATIGAIASAPIRALELLNSIFLVSKTVFNVPAYPTRNAITAMTSYGLANGVLPHDIMKELLTIFASRGFNPFADSKLAPARRINATEMRILGIDQRTLDVGIIQQQLAGGKYRDEADFFVQHAANVAEDAKRTKKQMALAKARGVAYKPVAATRKLYDISASLAQAIDAANKIAIYKKEKGILEQARQHDLQTGKDTGYGSMTDDQLSFLAAKKARSVAPTYSEAPLVAKFYRKTNPFFGQAFGSFFLDQFRIAYNQLIGRGDLDPRKGKESKSDNPVIRRRAAMRKVQATSTHGAFTAVPLLSVLFLLKLKLSEEEDELLAFGKQDYERDNQFIYLSGQSLIDLNADQYPNILQAALGVPEDIDPKGVYSLDLTYINGMSPVFDGTAASMMRLFGGGGFDEAALTAFRTYLGRFFQFGQIPNLAINYRQGKNSEGYPLYKEGDTLQKKVFDTFEQFADDVVLPGNVLKVKNYFKYKDADDPDVVERVESSLRGFASPFKFKNVKPEKNMYRASVAVNREREAVRDAAMAILKDGKESLSQEDVDEQALRIITSNQQTDEYMIKLIQAARNLGDGQIALTDEQIYKQMIDAGVGKARAQALLKNKTERFIPSVSTYKDLIEAGDWGETRARQLDNAIRRLGQGGRFQDVDTGINSDD